MKIKFIFQLIRAASAFSSWYKKAAEDGKISPSEIAEFLSEFSDIFGIKIDFNIPDKIE